MDYDNDYLFFQRSFLALFRRMSNMDPSLKRRKQSRVRKQLSRDILNENGKFMMDSENHSQDAQAILMEVLNEETQQRSGRKYQNYVQLIRKMGEYDWTNMFNENSKMVYPIQFLTAPALQFMISSSYFNCDQEYLENNLNEVQKILKKPLQLPDDLKKNKKNYDYYDDNFIMEIRNLQIKPIDDILSNLEEELLSLENLNQEAISNLSQIKCKPPLEVDQTINNGILRDISGLTEIEKQYIEKIEIRQQQQDVIETGKTNKKQNGGITLQVNLDDALCQVCNDGDYTDDNLIVFCSKCNISVHQKCYLIDIIPNEDWICDVCATFGKQGQYLRCALCPRLGGAMKPTKLEASLLQINNPTYYEAYGESLMKNDLVAKLFSETEGPNEDLYYDFSKLPNRTIQDFEDAKEPQPQKAWVHLSCFYWSPECYLDEKQDTLKGIENVHQKRFQLNCNICNIKKAGVCIQCAKGQCQTSYHVECARRAGIFMTVTVTNGKPDYQIFCTKHVPLKVKRILESKNRQYEREIIEFFRCYEKCRQLSKRGFKKLKPKKIPITQPTQRKENNNFVKQYDENDFALQLRQLLDKIVNDKIIVTIQNNVVTSVYEPIIRTQKQYILKKIPEYIANKLDKIGLNIVPFYKSFITATDEIWNHFVYQDYDNDLTYKIYEKIRRRAGRYMQEANPHKKQAKLADMLMMKKIRKGNKIEQKKEIYAEYVGEEEFVVHDENLYCVCRGKFKDGEPMIQCDKCEEWYHFDCLGLLLTEKEIENLDFFCFLCQDELSEEQNQQINLLNQSIFKEPQFKLQRELAFQCNLHEIRKQNLILKNNQQQEDIIPKENDFEDNVVKLVKNEQSQILIENIEIHRELEINQQNDNQFQQQQQQEIQEILEIQEIQQVRIEQIPLAIEQEQCRSIIQNDQIENPENNHLILSNMEEDVPHSEQEGKGNARDDMAHGEKIPSEHVKTPSKTESVEDNEQHKLEIPESQNTALKGKSLKQTSLMDFIRKK